MKRSYAIGFLAALALILAVSIGFHQPDKIIGLITCLMFGTAVVTYTYPVSGTTPPTAAQMQNADTVPATINFGDTDTTATFTHNFGETTTNLAALFPDVSFYPAVITTPSNTSPPIITVALLTNSLTFTKVSATNSGGVWNVLARRPSSIGN